MRSLGVALRVAAALAISAALCTAGCMPARPNTAAGEDPGSDTKAEAQREATGRMTDEEASRAQLIESWLSGARDGNTGWSNNIEAVTVSGNRLTVWLDESMSGKRLREDSLRSLVQEALAELGIQDYSRVDVWVPGSSKPARSVGLGHLPVAGERWQLVPGVRMTVPSDWRSDTAPVGNGGPLALRPGTRLSIYHYVDDYTKYDSIELEALSTQGDARERSMAPSGTQVTSLKWGSSEVAARSWTREPGWSGGALETELLIASPDGGLIRISSVFNQAPDDVSSPTDAKQWAVAVLGLLGLEAD